ncbi:hypothetical protein FNV43_RR25201 [Rhamnella rubrinervis]|uniref:PGG domain-containing protein n=1 Tax=Rhamnella rubrinervis TaxID=2594499 RepID=A0A8K0GRE6_9ROSA|nr:hypothetical protein FNV43_RR25201 [Rhamnella rubrinervis]
MNHIMRCDEDDKIKRLYEASMEGCVDTLKSLIQDDPLILSKISLSPYGETPLHVSALFGHLNFTKKLLSIKPQGPKLAMELDRLKRSPLHLASAEGHTGIVQALIQVNDSMCLATDQDGKTPLHYAAMRGRVEVIKLLIGSQRESIWKNLNEGGETVLHLCVQYNQLGALRVLVESVGYENNEFLNSKDQHGNTILHLAVMLKQIETIKYLLSLSGVKKGAKTTLNQSGFTAFDTLEHIPKDFKSLQIQNAFQDVGLQRGTQQCNHHQLQQVQPSSSSSSIKAKTSCWGKCNRLMRYKGDWIKDKTGALLIVATLIATLSYQTAVNPPGGVWQESRNNTVDCNFENNCTAGTSVLAHHFNMKHQSEYLWFLICNSMAFISSLIIILLLLSGFPVRYRPCMWLLNLAICSALTFTTITYVLGTDMVSPSKIDDVPTWWICVGLVGSWVGLIGIIIAFQTIRLLVWVVKKLFICMFKCCMCRAKRTPGNHNIDGTARV